MRSSLFDYLNDTVQQPLFLAGANLALGGGADGVTSGLKTGWAMQKSRREEEEKRRRAMEFAGLLNDPGIGQALGPLAPLVRAAGPEAGLKMASDAILRGPEQELGRRMTEAQIRSLDAATDVRRRQALALAGGGATAPADPLADAVRRHNYKPRWSSDPEDYEDENDPGSESASSSARPSNASPRAPLPGRIGGTPTPSGALPMPKMRLGGPEEDPDDYVVGPQDKTLPMGVGIVDPGGKSVRMALGAATLANPSPRTPRAIRVSGTGNPIHDDPSALTDRERALGITVDEKLRQERIKYLSDGKSPKVGQVWALDREGNLIQRRVMEKETKRGDVSPEMIASTIVKLNAAERVLGGSVGKDGAPAGDGPWTVTRLASELTQGRIRPDIYQAMLASQESAMKTIMALSGKSFSKFELESDLKMFKPLATDTDEMSRSKIAGMRHLLLSLDEARNSGLRDDELRSPYRSALERATDVTFGSAGRRVEPSGRSNSQPASGAPTKRMVYDKATGRLREAD